VSVKRLYRVFFEGGESLLVVATSAGAAIRFAEDYLGKDSADSVEPYTENPKAWLWVGFLSAQSCEEQIQKLLGAGLSGELIRKRITESLTRGPTYWEVGCRAESWCRYEEGVLPLARGDLHD
jgi:hypothetical protein